MPREIKLTQDELLTKPLFPRRPKSEWVRSQNCQYSYGRRAETEYYKYLKGKRVILVGPAGYLKGSGQGEWIDSFDVVVRMNLSCPVAEELKQDIGSRTDVLYHTLIGDRHVRANPEVFHYHTQDDFQAWRDDGVRWLVLRHPYNHARVQRYTSLWHGVFDWVTMIGYKMRSVESQIGTLPNMGTMAIWHILQSKCEYLHVVGCDYHTSGYYPTYGGFDEEQAAKGARGEDGMKLCWGQTADNAGSKPLHFVPVQVEFLRKLKRRYRERFRCDEQLAALIEGKVAL